MFIKTMKEALPYILNARISTMIHGFHGVGKSVSIKQFCQENKYKFVDIRLGNMEVGDLLGLAEFVRDVKTGKALQTSFIPPDWVREVIDYGNNNPKSKVIIFLDEISRARRDLLQATFQLSLDNKHHMTELPDNCHVIAATNPSTDDYVITDIVDLALLSRFCHIKLTPSTSEWFEFAESQEYDEDIINFLKEAPENLQASQQDYSLDFIKPNRRAWEFINRLRKINTPVHILQEISYGLVGTAVTAAFIESLKSTDKPFKAEDILDKWEDIEKKVKKYSDPDNNRMDLLKYSGDNLVKHVQQRKDKFSKSQEKNLTAFLKAIPAELSFSLCRGLYLEKIAQDCIDKDEDLRNMFKKARRK